MRLTALSILLFASAAHAQVAPVTAQATETTQVVSASSTAATTHTRAGNYYRRADGSTLTQWLSADGDTTHPVASLSNPGANVSYQLDLSNSTGTKLPGASEPIIAPRQTSPANLPHSNVAGIACTVYPVKPGSSSPGPGSAAGSVCVADQYGLVVMRDLTYVGQDGNTHHEHYQLTSIQLNAAPPAALFDLTAFNIQ
jgi:hypothetical protein